MVKVNNFLPRTTIGTRTGKNTNDIFYWLKKHQEINKEQVQIYRFKKYLEKFKFMPTAYEISRKKNIQKTKFRTKENSFEFTTLLVGTVPVVLQSCKKNSRFICSK
jgi:hypothetical protein